MAAVHVVVERAALAEGDADHGALGGVRGLADGFRHFTGLAVTEADAALLVADDDESGKAETTAALHHLGDAVDVDQAVHEFAVALFAISTFSWFSSHETSHLRGRRARSLRVAWIIPAVRNPDRLHGQRRPEP